MHSTMAWQFLYESLSQAVLILCLGLGIVNVGSNIELGGDRLTEPNLGVLRVWLRYRYYPEFLYHLPRAYAKPARFLVLRNKTTECSERQKRPSRSPNSPRKKKTSTVRSHHVIFCNSCLIITHKRTHLWAPCNKILKAAQLKKGP